MDALPLVRHAAVALQGNARARSLADDRDELLAALEGLLLAHVDPFSASTFNSAGLAVKIGVV